MNTIKNILWTFLRIKAQTTPRITVVMGDLVEQRTDCIVNATDEALRGGTGVDGAIHEAAGPELGRACKQFKGCSIGRTVVTSGYQLPSRWIIHTVAPVWSGEDEQEEILEWCFRNCFKEAQKLKSQSIAFPTLGAGAFGWPTDLVAQAAQRAIAATKFYDLEEIRFVAFNKRDFAVWQKTFGVEGKIQKKEAELLYHRGIAVDI